VREGSEGGGVMARRPIVTVAAVDVQCPECQEFVASPASGALFFEANEYRPGTEIDCDACGTRVVLPALKTVRWK
jgi:ribosomal protein S27E